MFKKKKEIGITLSASSISVHSDGAGKVKLTQKESSPRKCFASPLGKRQRWHPADWPITEISTPIARAKMKRRHGPIKSQFNDPRSSNDAHHSCSGHQIDFY